MEEAKRDPRKDKEEFDFLCNKYSGLYADLVCMQEEQCEYVNTHGPDTYGRFKSQCETWLTLVESITTGVNYIDKKDWPKYRSVQFLLIVNNITYIHGARILLLKGYWESSLVLCRSALEAFVRILWISCHPQDSEAGVSKIGNGVQFNFTGFVKDQLKLDWFDYEFLSMKAHGNRIGVIKDWISINKGTMEYPITFDRPFDKKSFEIGINYVLFLETIFLLFLTEIIVTQTNEKHLSEEVLADSKKLGRLMQRCLLNHSGDYWPIVGKDIDDLLELVLRCDKENKHFKAIWKELRMSPKVS